MENKICKIEGCNRKARAKGLCMMHYSRKRYGSENESPNRLEGWSWNKRPPIKKCKIENCNREHYAKGYCEIHYKKNRRNGYVLSSRDLLIKPKAMCSAKGCIEYAKIKGFCQFHYERYRKGVSFIRPKGIKGKLNPNWNGGTAQYSNHSEMKRMRKKVLFEENYTCFYCGEKPVNEIHHIDKSKDNHKRENLHACCHSCNMKMSKIHTSKYRKLYGYNLEELSKITGFSIDKIRRLHARNKFIFFDSTIHENDNVIIPTAMSL